MNKKLILLGAFLILFSSCATIKTPPLGVNFEGPLRDAKNVDFHYDLTYLDKDGNIKYDRNIWQSTYDIVDNAKDYLIVEMFYLMIFIIRIQSYSLNLQKNTPQELLRKKEKIQI